MHKFYKRAKKIGNSLFPDINPNSSDPKNYLALIKNTHGLRHVQSILADQSQKMPQNRLEIMDRANLRPDRNVMCSKKLKRPPVIRISTKLGNIGLGGKNKYYNN